MRHLMIGVWMLAGAGAALGQIPATEAPATRPMSPPAATTEAEPMPPADAIEPSAWQSSITGQIEAFREADGVAALEYAGQGFKNQFEDPDVFYQAILASGYEAIVNSRSHSFGEFEMVRDNFAVQVVRFVGPDQRLYEGLYQMLNEADGWRVQGVVLRQEAGVGI